MLIVGSDATPSDRRTHHDAHHYLTRLTRPRLGGKPAVLTELDLVPVA
jgi:hypothetical protein